MDTGTTFGGMVFEGVKTLGAVAGFAAFAMNILNAKRAYLQQKIEVRDEGDERVLFVDLQVQNSSPWSKELSHAFLVIAPYENDIVSQRDGDESAGNKLVDEFNKRGFALERPKYTNDLERFPMDASLEIEDYTYIPLPYFFSENVRVSDETLYYSAALDKQYYELGKAYAIRFFITDGKRLHRSVHTAFLLSRSSGVSARRPSEAQAT